MKTKNWRKALSAGCVSGGLMMPSAAQGAPIDVNLVINSGFENVDLASIGDYNGPRILDWVGTAFAYSHDGSSSNAGVVPDYAHGPPLPGGGSWYFSSNNSPPTVDIRDPNLFYQDINVSTGLTGAAIATGQAEYDLSAFMASYLNDTDFGNVRAEFKDSGGGILGFALISDSDFGPFNVWSQNSTQGSVPMGTESVRISLYGTRTAGGGGADGYIDNVDFRIVQTTQVPEPSTGSLAFLVLTALGFMRRRRRDAP